MRGAYSFMMLFSTREICSLRAFSSGSVCRYSYVSMIITLASLAMGSTFLTFFTKMLYCCRCFSFLNVCSG